MGWGRAFLPAAVSPRRLIVMYIHPSTHPFSKREWERPTGSEAPMLNRMHRSCPCSLYLGPGLLCLSLCLSICPQDSPQRPVAHSSASLGRPCVARGPPRGPGVTPVGPRGPPAPASLPIDLEQHVFTGDPSPLGVDG